MTSLNTPAYRRVHRLTPLLRAWAVAAALLTVLVFNFTTALVEGVEGVQREGGGWSVTDIVQVVGGVAVMIGLAFVVSQLWWSRIGFRLGEDEVELRSGLISTKVRSARYGRIQAVDVVEPFAPRLFRLAAVRIEAAGGSDSAIEIGYVPRSEAEELRRDLLHRIAAQGPDAEMSAEEADAAISAGAGPVARARTGLGTRPASGDRSGSVLIPPIPVGRSLAGAALRLSTLFTVGFSLLPALTEVTFAVVVPVLVGFIPQIWRQIDQSWRYTSTLDGDVLNLSYGLANRRRQAVPLDRIHAIGLSQPVLWRPFGWWTVTVNVAGYGRESNKQSGTSRLLPVGTREQAIDLITAISPLGAHQITSPAWDVRSPKRARIPSPIDASRQALSLSPLPSEPLRLSEPPLPAKPPRHFEPLRRTDQTATVWATTSHGLLSRRFEFIDISHIQEVTYRQGPVQRMLNLAHVRFNLVPGPVKMKARDLDTADAWAVVGELSARELPPLADPRDRG